MKRREWRSAWGGRGREGERKRERKREREREKSARTRERESKRKRFGSSSYMFFSSTWACPMQIGLSQECCLFCLFCLKSSLWSSDLPCLLATAILDSFSLFYLPNNTMVSRPFISKPMCRSFQNTVFLLLFLQAIFHCP